MARYTARRKRFSTKFMSHLRRKLSSWSSAAIAVLLPAPRAEVTPLSPCSSPSLGPKQRHRRARPRPSGEAAPPSPCSSSPLGPKQRHHRRAPPRPFGRSSAAITLLLLAPRVNQRRHRLAPPRSLGRSNDAIAVLLPAPRAEATPPSPCLSLLLGPKQRRHRRAPPRPSGLPSTPWMWRRVAGNIHQDRGSSRAKLAPLPRSHAARCSQAVEGAMSRPGGCCGAGGRVGAVQPEGGRKGLK